MQVSLFPLLKIDRSTVAVGTVSLAPRESPTQILHSSSYSSPKSPKTAPTLSSGIQNPVPHFPSARNPSTQFLFVFHSCRQVSLLPHSPLLSHLESTYFEIYTVSQVWDSTLAAEKHNSPLSTPYGGLNSPCCHTQSVLQQSLLDRSTAPVKKRY